MFVSANSDVVIVVALQGCVCFILDRASEVADARRSIVRAVYRDPA